MGQAEGEGKGARKKLIKGNDVVRCNSTSRRNAAVNGGGAGSFEKYGKAAKGARPPWRTTKPSSARGKRMHQCARGRGTYGGGWHIFRAESVGGPWQFCHACFSQDLCPTVPPFNGASCHLRLLSPRWRSRRSTSYRPITVWRFSAARCCTRNSKGEPDGYNDDTRILSGASDVTSPRLAELILHHATFWSRTKNLSGKSNYQIIW